MKTLNDKTAANELIGRINRVDEHSTPLWGKMSAGQMLQHLTMWEEMALNKTRYKQSFIGRLFGKMALKGMMKDEPVKRNMPTVPGFVTDFEGDIATEKQKLTDLINAHGQGGGQDFIHPFFGRLTAEQGGLMAYKHADHHLQQFGV